jgi:hypothetical protein
MILLPIGEMLLPPEEFSTNSLFCIHLETLYVNLCENMYL